MEDRSCPTCKRNFKFPSDLKKHFACSYHCKKSENEINEFFNKNPINKKIRQKKNYDTICKNCNKELSTHGSLIRHNNICKGVKIETVPPIQIENIIKDLDTDAKKKIYKVVIYMK
jgi:hypothetical protein